MTRLTRFFNAIDRLGFLKTVALGVTGATLVLSTSEFDLSSVSTLTLICIWAIRVAGYAMLLPFAMLLRGARSGSTPIPASKRPVNLDDDDDHMRRVREAMEEHERLLEHHNEAFEHPWLCDDARERMDEHEHLMERQTEMMEKTPLQEALDNQWIRSD